MSCKYRTGTINALKSESSGKENKSCPTVLKKIAQTFAGPFYPLPNTNPHTQAHRIHKSCSVEREREREREEERERSGTVAEGEISLFGALESGER